MFGHGPLKTPPAGSNCAYVLTACAGLLMCLAVPAPAAMVDLSLNLFYEDPEDPDSGGTWTLSAKSDEFGIHSVDVLLQNIVSTASSVFRRAPFGIVNGDEIAGFKPPLVANDLAAPGVTTIFIRQDPSPTLEGDEPIFYGVGSIVDPEGGVPNYPDQATDFPDSMSIGPELASLSLNDPPSSNNLPWGDGDELGDAEWDSAAVLLGGAFPQGLTPSFFSDSQVGSRATVFTSLGTSETAGEISDLETTTVTTTIRSNLVAVELDGDYNEDGVVDAADYTLWRDTLGATVSMGTGADGDGSGVIDAGDYTVWKSNFGSSVPGAAAGSLSPTAVPEPQTLVVSAFAAMALGLARRRRGFRRSVEIRGEMEFLEKSLIEGETA